MGDGSIHTSTMVEPSRLFSRDFYAEWPDSSYLGCQHEDEMKRLAKVEDAKSSSKKAC